MSDWNLAIVHFHLNPGGVTRVISGHLDSLATLPADRQPRRVVLVFDGQSDQWAWEPPEAGSRFRLELLVVPELRYDGEQCGEAARLERSLADVLRSAGLSPENTVLHVHNHTLGKNTALPPTLQSLAQSGYRQLLQIHDFAEDIRPANYRHMAKCYGAIDAVPQQIYFHADHVHYAVLNGRDAAVLQAAGLPPDRLHSVPNPVFRPEEERDPHEARRKVEAFWKPASNRQLMLYPVRGIRRKNVGELLLWSLVCGESAFFVMTLPPRNPLEQPVYARWVSLAKELGLPVDLAAATHKGIDFDDLVAAADWEITTSIAEGFGLVYLESWLAGKPLLGRDLPDITTDFKDAGVVFPHLNDQVAIPWEWLDRGEVAGHWRDHYQRVLEAYGLEPPREADIDRDLELLLSSPTIDWAFLDWEVQQRLLLSLRAQSSGWDLFWDRNPVMRACRDARIADAGKLAELVRHNGERILGRFGLHACGDRLYDIYSQLLASGSTGAIEPLPAAGAVLTSFLKLDRIHPIRLA